MNLLPQASGNRPRLACEISSQGVVAARADAPTAPLAAVARATLAAGAVVPGLKPGNIADRVATIAAVRRTLEQVGAKPGSRDAALTLVIPDAAVRVLLLDFDSLPTKISEALPIVRFRLKKMLPFEADDAMLSYQVMSTSKQMVRVLAVAIPRDVLAEYESVAREAGFEPGAVLPSTLSCIAAIDESVDVALMVNATPTGVTSAIVRSGILMLHRSVDLQPEHVLGATPVTPEEWGDTTPDESLVEIPALPLVDIEETAEEWALQQALPEHGRNPYAEAAPVENSPYASPSLFDDFSSELHNNITVSPLSLHDFAAEAVHNPALATAPQAAAFDLADHFSNPIAALTLPHADREIAEAVNVAAAYFEDTLGRAPEVILAAGPFGAEGMQRILNAFDVTRTDGLRVRELVAPEALLADAVTSSVPRGWLSGVAGALKG